MKYYVRLFANSIRLSAKRLKKYPADAACWFLADVCMYASTLALYGLLGTEVSYFAGYSVREILLYLSTCFVIDNVFSVFFSEALDYYALDVWNGKMYYSMLKPVHTVQLYFSMHMNLKAGLVTPVLAVLWFLALMECQAGFSIFYILLLLWGAVNLMALQLLFVCFDYIGIHSDSFSPVTVQFYNLRERPDSVFPQRVRNVFIYLVPVFMTSAVPFRILLGRASLPEEIWFLLLPFAGAGVHLFVKSRLIRKYDLGTEE